MYEETSPVSQPMATDQGAMTDTTGDNGVTSSSSGGATSLYFECFCVVIGLIGVTANGLVLYALVASKQHKKHELIVNQNAIDLYTCLFLVITFGLQLSDMNMSGSLGYWLCVLLHSENLLVSGIHGSSVNLTFIAD